jgi:hypothetical protein
MKSITYSMVGLFILTLVFGVGNSFAQPTAAQELEGAVSFPWDRGPQKKAFEEKSVLIRFLEGSLTPLQLKTLLERIPATGAGGTLKGYAQPIEGWDAVAA